MLIAEPRCHSSSTSRGHIQTSMNQPISDDPCLGNPRPKNAGQIVAIEHPEMEYGPEKWSVVTVGGGSFEMIVSKMKS